MANFDDVDDFFQIGFFYVLVFFLRQFRMITSLLNSDFSVFVINKPSRYSCGNDTFNLSKLDYSNFCEKLQNGNCSDLHFGGEFFSIIDEV